MDDAKQNSEPLGQIHMFVLWCSVSLKLVVTLFFALVGALGSPFK